MSKFVDDVMCLAMAVDATAGFNARRALLSQLQANLEAREAVTADLLEALKGLTDVIEAAGLMNLVRGVPLGPTSWFVKASDRMAAARAAITKATGEPA